MEKHFYDANSLSRVLTAYEARFGMPSADFYAAYLAHDEEMLASVPHFYRHVWASFYRDCQRMSGDDFAASVERDLATA